MKIQQVDDTPIKNIGEDWGNPDGTGKKAKTLGQVQKFIKAKINEIENKTVRIEKSNKEFESKIINQIENYKPVEIHGDVANAADEEDLTSEDGLLKIKNRNYLNGKGFVILRQSKTRSGSKTILTQDHFNQKNTIYEIRYDFNLNGQTIKIPEGCTLMFTGGSLDNGCLLGTNTAIVAGAYKIFGDNLMLHQYCFARKNGNYGEKVIPLEWENIQNRTVKLPEEVTQEWKISTAGNKVRNSNMTIGQDDYYSLDFVEIPDNRIINVDNDMILSHSPQKVITASGYNNALTPAQFNNGKGRTFVGVQSLNTSNLFRLDKYLTSDGTADYEENGQNIVVKNIFTVPPSAYFVFYKGNTGTPNEEILKAGDTIDLTIHTLYSAVLLRPIINPEASTWCTSAKLEWFITDYYGNYEDFLNSEEPLTDQTANLQRALDCSMDLESNIRGVIPISDTIYLETTKKIDLGGNYSVTNTDEWVSNARWKVKWSLPCTVLAAIGNFDDKELVRQRVKINLTGGMFTTNFAASHYGNVWTLDMDYKMSSSFLKTTLIGRKRQEPEFDETSKIDTPKGTYSSYAGMYINTTNCVEGHTSNYDFHIWTSFTKYGLYATQLGPSDTYINTCNVNCHVYGFYEGIHIVSAFGSSNINVSLQAFECVPYDEVDNYRATYIKTARSTINIVNWDFPTKKNGNTGGLSTTYRKILILGNNYVYGNSDLQISGNYFELIPNYGNHSVNPNTIVTRTSNTPIRLPLLQNVVAGISEDIIDADKSYIYKFNSKEIDVNSDFKSDVSVGDNLKYSPYFKNAFEISTDNIYVKETTLSKDDYVELHIECKDGFTLDNATKFSHIALDWISVNVKYYSHAKILLHTSDNIYPVNFDIIKEFDFSYIDTDVYINIKAITLRLWGVNDTYDIKTNAIITPKIRVYSVHESYNFFRRRFQQRVIGNTKNIALQLNLLQGVSFYDTTLRRPLWCMESGNENAWLDPTSTRITKNSKNTIDIIQGERVVHSHNSTDPLIFNLTGCDGLATNRAYSFELDLRIISVPESVTWKEGDKDVTIKWIKTLELMPLKRFLMVIDKNGDEYIGMYTTLNL